VKEATTGPRKCHKRPKKRPITRQKSPTDTGRDNSSWHYALNGLLKALRARPGDVAVAVSVVCVYILYVFIHSNSMAVCAS
jgi:hypothetical protein